MNFQVDVSSGVPQTAAQTPPPAPASNVEVVDLLKQLLEVQREQLSHQRAAASAHDASARWRAFLSRWQGEFPDLSDNCRRALPALERCYGAMIAELTERLTDEDTLDSDFAVQEFLDRFGMRLMQLGTILNLVGPLAEAGSTQGDSGS